MKPCRWNKSYVICPRVCFACFELVFNSCHLTCFIDLHTQHDCLFYYDDVIKWKHFPRNWPFVRGIHRSPVNSPHKGQWRGALMFSLICVWINYWVNNREAGDLIRHRAHYDVIVMLALQQPQGFPSANGVTRKEEFFVPINIQNTIRFHGIVSVI